jgi:hypothetical protein
MTANMDPLRRARVVELITRHWLEDRLALHEANARAIERGLVDTGLNPLEVAEKGFAVGADLDATNDRIYDLDEIIAAREAMEAAYAETAYTEEEAYLQQVAQDDLC